MKEPLALIAKANRYLKSAELLLRDGDYESSVSRSYYAMFHCAQALLLTKDLTFSSHKGVISAFGEQFIKTGVFPREWGRQLNKGFEKRQLGDYEAESGMSDEDAKDMLARAREFCAEVERWIGELQR
ncbi:MAG: HEPN domain-containing protein [Planctomycetes bacterium]|nr:HEPN domain-containing protein [Planctomycetota bacterium]